MRGKPEPKKRISSRGDEATLANPLDPPARGWAAVSRRLNEASATLRDATSRSFERVSAVVTADLAYTVAIKHYQGQQFAGSDERHDFDIRVRTIFRKRTRWLRIVHRHADGITTARLVECVLQR
jgi:ketosteroid isomerase-like protein